MPTDHTCPDCCRKFTSGAALGGHRRVHTKGRLTKDKGYKTNKRRRPPPLPNNHNINHAKEHRVSPEPYSEQKFYGEYVTDISSEEDEDEVQNNDIYWNSNEFSAMPPPIKKRKLNDPINNGSGPSSIGYVIKCPQNLKKPTKMDAIREQIGLAMTLYHFNASKLAEYADIHKQIFIKWLQGGMDQKPNVGVNSNSNSNTNSNKPPSKPSKTPMFKIKFKRSLLKSAKTSEKTIMLTPLLSDKIAEKMQKWLDDFIHNGFLDKRYLEFVHHYKRYKRNATYNVKKETHSFDNMDMKWNKIKHEDAQFMEKRNDNPMFDWNDDSSFYYKMNDPREKEEEGAMGDLIPIQMDAIVRGKPFRDSFLWNPHNDTQQLTQFIQSLCNDLKEGQNETLKANMVKSAEKQIKQVKKIRSEYRNALDSFGNKISNRANNYLQHLKKKSISVNDNMNLMNNITDICHGHILIKLRVTHGKVRLVDEFLWNLNDNHGTIEAFAKTLCADQGLPFVFSSSIAVSIRQQINAHKVRMTKSMNQNGNNLNTINDPLSHESLRFVGRQKETGLRNLKMWEPTILVHKPPNRMRTKLRDQ